MMRRLAPLTLLTLILGAWLGLQPQHGQAQILTKDATLLGKQEAAQQRLLAKQARKKSLNKKQTEKEEARARRKAAQYRVEIYTKEGKRVSSLYRDCANLLRVRVFDNRKNEEIKDLKLLVSLRLATIFRNIDDKGYLQIIPADTVTEIYFSTLNPKNQKLNFIGQVKLPVRRVPVPRIFMTTAGEKGSIISNLGKVTINFEVNSEFRAQCPADANYQLEQLIVYRRPEGRSSKSVVDSLRPAAGDVAALDLSRVQPILKPGDEVSFEVTGLNAINFNRRPVNLIDYYEYKELLFVMLYRP